MHDDDLSRFAAEGAAPLPVADEQGYVANEGAQIWYASYGAGAAVILLHGGLGHSGNWGYQVPALVGAGYRVVVIDSRGHGRSTRDAQPYSYELMASDVAQVMQVLQLAQASLVGWSDGACTALVLAVQSPAQVAGVLFFGCNMDPSGVKEFVFTPIIGRCLSRHKQDYAQLSATPDQFDAFAEAVGRMQSTQPNYSAQDLAALRVPVLIVHSEHDEFIRREHAEYLSRSIPNAGLVHLPGVSHFAPLQRPELFNSTVLAFLGAVLKMEPSAGTLRDEEDPDLGFTYRVRKSSEIQIRHRGRVAAILRGAAAADFLAEAEGDFAAGQQAMARLTGNYKHGNERVARRHPRNRR